MANQSGSRWQEIYKSAILKSSAGASLSDFHVTQYYEEL